MSERSSRFTYKYEVGTRVKHTGYKPEKTPRGVVVDQSTLFDNIVRSESTLPWSEEDLKSEFGEDHPGYLIWWDNDPVEPSFLGYEAEEVLESV